MGTEYLDSVDPGNWAARAMWKDRTLYQVIKLSLAKGHIINRDLAIELPRIYPMGKSKARPNDIIKLAITAGGIAEHWTGNVTWYAPRDWKAQVPDHILYGIEGRIWKLLTVAERDILSNVCEQYGESYAHNLYDAVGVGLRHLKRAGNGMVP